jgi:hypothetical protein
VQAASAASARVTIGRLEVVQEGPWSSRTQLPERTSRLERIIGQRQRRRWARNGLAEWRPPGPFLALLGASTMSAFAPLAGLSTAIRLPGYEYTAMPAMPRGDEGASRRVRCPHHRGCGRPEKTQGEEGLTCSRRPGLGVLLVLIIIDAAFPEKAKAEEALSPWRGLLRLSSWRRCRADCPRAPP